VAGLRVNPTFQPLSMLHRPASASMATPSDVINVRTAEVNPPMVGVVVPTSQAANRYAYPRRSLILGGFLTTLLLGGFLAAEMQLLLLGRPLASPMRLAKYYAAIATAQVAGTVRALAAFLQSPQRSPLSTLEGFASTAMVAMLVVFMAKLQQAMAAAVSKMLLAGQSWLALVARSRQYAKVMAARAQQLAERAASRRQKAAEKHAEELAKMTEVAFWTLATGGAVGAAVKAVAFIGTVAMGAATAVAIDAANDAAASNGAMETTTT